MALKDTPWNRMKMRWYVKGIEYAIQSIAGDDDPGIWQEDMKGQVAKIKKEWNL